ncbi:hypothetical protein HYH03_010119 [Edaphochlamys debaryana]|uniref:Uncharacterized protein n=1 Tax=Edaphochlamys debaryana TaxID=47281 RepID=A0A836BXS9_9CHLO|nr:hypothetical protein HYH03_010119 [Edaphochlamys debaryana]|eukprot:KAG2491548.1 hypothetical protein HYH03_010119 [Edaphochlamys debaryana]
MNDLTTRLRVKLEADTLFGDLVDGRWLEPWPRLEGLFLSADWAHAAVVPLRNAHLPALKQLELACKKDAISCAAVATLVARAPQLSELSLYVPPAPQLSELSLYVHPAAQQLCDAPALAALHRLTSLTVSSFAWLPYIAEAGLSSLTKLNVAGNGWACPRPKTDAIVAMLSTLPALRELRLSCDFFHEFHAADVHNLLAGLPTTVQSVSLAPAALYSPPPNTRDAQLCGDVAFGLSNGFLTSVSIHPDNTKRAKPTPAGQLSRFLVDAILPCRALGPRLEVLHLHASLDLFSAHGSAAGGLAGAAELLSRCAQVEIDELVGGYADGRDVMDMARFVGGVPGQLSRHTEGLGQLVVVLRRSCAAGAEASAEAFAAAGAACGPRGAEGTAGAVAGAGVLPPPMPGPDVLRRAVQRMTSPPPPIRSQDGSGSSWGSSPQPAALHGGGYKPALSPGLGSAEGAGAGAGVAALVLRGPEVEAGLAGLGAGPCHQRSAALGALVARCCLPLRGAAGAGSASAGGAAATSRGDRRPLRFWALPSAGVVLLEAAGTLRPEAAAPGEAAAAGVEVLPARVGLAEAVTQVLQGLWDGTEEGGPCSGARELERLAWLLEAWEGLRGLTHMGTVGC